MKPEMDDGIIPLDKMSKSAQYSFLHLHPKMLKVINKDRTENSFESSAMVFTRIGQAEQFIAQNPIYYDRAKIWWIWNKQENYWELTDETDLLNCVSKSLGMDVVPGKVRTEILTALQMVARRQKPKDALKTWIQFRNGLVDLNNPGEIFMPSPAHFITNPIPWKYGLSSETPVMDKIFEQWVGKEYSKTLYEILAYSLLPDYPIHRLFCFIGSGMNGKSKYLELLRRFIGDKNCCSTELDTLLTSRFEVKRLHKKLVCQMGETNFSEMSKTSMLKKLSGGDLIGFEYKGKDPFEDLNYAKILISTNNLPTTTDKTVGFYRRWLIIDFPNQFSEKKDILSEIPEQEFENLSRKCIEILSELLVNREFTNEGSIEERMRKYEDHSDPLEKFMKEFTEEDVNGDIWKFEFEKKLNQWCKENRFREMGERTIGKKMKEKGIVQILKTADWFTDGVKKQSRCWIGIRWKGGI